MSARIVIAGLGNIGSFLVRLVARLPRVTDVTLIDFDRYEAGNLASQDISPADVGRPKAEVQAELLRSIRPDLRVQAIVDRIENVPLGAFRCDLIVACLDSKRARQSINERAWRLGIPWIDAGVAPADSLVRVSVYAPSESSPCIECEWDDADYARIEQVQPCFGNDYSPAAPTGAPAFLGAAAAAIQCAEIEKSIDADGDQAVVPKRMVLSLADNRLYSSELRRNPECRFDHDTWRIEPLDADVTSMTVGGLLGLLQRNVGAGALEIGVPSLPFVTGLRCSACGRSEAVLRLRNRTASEQDCRCGGRMQPTGMDTTESLSADAIPEALLDQTLAETGFLSRDVLRIRTSAHGQDLYYELRPNLEETR